MIAGKHWRLRPTNTLTYAGGMSYKLSQRAVDEFKCIYLDEFAEELSDAEANEMAIKLLRLFSILLDGPTPA